MHTKHFGIIGILYDQSLVNICIFAFSRCFGTRQSLSKYRLNRLVRSFETIDAATKRTKTNSDQITAGTKKERNHVGNLDQIVWDKNGFTDEVSYKLATVYYYTQYVL